MPRGAGKNLAKNWATSSGDRVAMCSEFAMMLVANARYILSRRGADGD
jgi:hypothetical protein